jgi:hypothetical protein
VAPWPCWTVGETRPSVLTCTTITREGVKRR